MSNNPMSWQKPELTSMEKYMVRRFHPRRILIDMASLPWAAYFLWQQNWMAALVAALVGGMLGYQATKNVDAESYSQTPLGSVAFVHLQPANAAIQLVGIVALVWALWTHSGPGLLGSMSTIFLGHLAGWDELWGKAEVSLHRHDAA